MQCTVLIIFVGVYKFDKKNEKENYIDTFYHFILQIPVQTACPGVVGGRGATILYINYIYITTCVYIYVSICIYTTTCILYIHHNVYVYIWYIYIYQYMYTIWK